MTRVHIPHALITIIYQLPNQEHVIEWKLRTPTFILVRNNIAETKEKMLHLPSKAFFSYHQPQNLITSFLFPHLYFSISMTTSMPIFNTKSMKKPRIPVIFTKIPFFSLPFYFFSFYSAPYPIQCSFCISCPIFSFLISYVTKSWKFLFLINFHKFCK